MNTAPPLSRARIYDLIYALAARDGRHKTLFGNTAPLARAAFENGLCGTAFPELWFEQPLAGEPWFDLHMLVAHDDRYELASFAGLGGVYAHALDWFATSEDTRQLALSFDTGRGSVDKPAIQLLLERRSVDAARGFLTAAGRANLTDAYRSFIRAMPSAWYACYLGVFPARTSKDCEVRANWVRVECIVGHELQHAYAQDAELLRAHLEQVGLLELGDTLIPRVQELARSSFPLEFQFDVDADGGAMPTFSASLRFSVKDWHSASQRAAIDQQWQRAQDWGLADDRWHQLAGTVYANRVAFAGKSARLYCYPAFIKLRWRDGEPLDAKAYLVAGTT